ncbi:MAG TPA: ribosomal protein S18-alanine N-acetyltransferase [Acidimicrobiia bacterium]|nr:ribosomal protein S18-alanine N-acetyltransferase [Acidimicrobiia bacterium]
MGGIATGVIDIRPMLPSDIPAVYRLECATFPQPWSEGIFRDELAQTGRSYFVAVDDSGEVAGYAGLLQVSDEAHVTTIAVSSEARGRKLGTRLMLCLIDAALAGGGKHLTLEVRTSNRSAQDLYRRFGMAPVGVRKSYYGDEDALIMWVHEIDQPQFGARLEEIRSGLA